MPFIADDFAVRIVTFLDLESSRDGGGRHADPQRQLRRDLLAALPQDEVGFRRSIFELAEALASRYRAEPTRWAGVVETVETYVRDEWTNQPHPMADAQPTRHPSPESPPERRVAFGLGRAVLERLLARSTVDDRATFFAYDLDWNVLLVLKDVLPHAALEVREVSFICNALDRLTDGDGFSRIITGAMRGWATQHRDVARVVVDEYFGSRRLPHWAIFDFVEAVVVSAEDVDWRARTTTKLAERSETRRLALTLEWSAWPADDRPSAEARLPALLRAASTLSEPDQSVVVGLIGRDPSVSHEAGIDMALDAMRSLDRLDSQHLLRELVDLVANALHAGTTPSVAAMESLLALNPDDAGQLDFLLLKLLSVDPGRVESFVREWLQRHAPQFVQVALPDVLGHTCRDLPQGVAGRLVIGWFLHHDPRVSLAASYALAKRFGTQPDGATYLALSSNESLALAHIIAGSRVPGQQWIPMLLSFASVRPDVVDLAASILCEDGCEEFPGVTRRVVESLSTSSEDGRSTEHRANLERLRDSVLATLTRSQVSMEALVAIPELRATVPASSSWNRMLQRTFQRAMREAKQESVFLQIVSEVPIARGESSMFALPGVADPARVKFTEHRSEPVEFPRRESFDLVGARARVASHRRAAREHLERREGVGT